MTIIRKFQSIGVVFRYLHVNDIVDKWKRGRDRERKEGKGSDEIPLACE